MKQLLAIACTMVVFFGIFMGCGDKTPTGPSATATPTGPTPTACETSVFGENPISSTMLIANPNVIFATQYSNPVDRQLTGLSFNAVTTGSVVLGIYKDVSGTPDELIARTTLTNITTTGNHTINLLDNIGLPAGDYWLAAIASTAMVTVGSSGFSYLVLTPANANTLLNPFTANGTAIPSGFSVRMNGYLSCQW